MDYLRAQLVDSHLSVSETERTIGADGEKIPVLEITMPDRKSKLLYMPLPSYLAARIERYCLQDDEGIYHHIKPSAAYAIQPRRTKCYSYTYNYSKTVHPVEPKTPRHIRKLYKITNALFGLDADDGVNMDLANYYSNGRHSIGRHSDDERQFGHLKDVYCWIFGPTCSEEPWGRLGIFRDKKDKSEVLRLKIPQGLYVMQGLSFQRHYTHEFPELYPALFKRLVAACSIKFDRFPKNVPITELGAPQEKIIQADWIKNHRNRVRKLIRAGGVSKGKKIKVDLENFEEWCLDRTSHTLRQFIK